MKVILTKDSKAGKKHQIVEVSTGYATNFLFKQNLALPYNNNTKKQLDRIFEEEAKEEQKKVEEAQKLKEKLEKIQLNFKLKTSLRNDVNINVHSSITAKHILKDLEEFHKIKLDRHSLEQVHINTLGITYVTFDIYKNVKATVAVNIKKDE